MPRLEKEVIVCNKKGLHARPAAMFVQLADKFPVTVTVCKGPEKVNGKSIMGLLMLGAQQQTKLMLVVEGDQAQLAMDELAQFFTKQEEDFVK